MKFDPLRINDYDEWLDEKYWRGHSHFVYNPRNFTKASWFAIKMLYRAINGPNNFKKLRQIHEETGIWQFEDFTMGRRMEGEGGTYYNDRYFHLIDCFKVEKYPDHSGEYSDTMVMRMLNDWPESHWLLAPDGIQVLREYMEAQRQPGFWDSYKEGTVGHWMGQYYKHYNIEYLLDRNERLGRPWYAGLTWDDENHERIRKRQQENNKTQYEIDLYWGIGCAINVYHDFHHALHNVSTSMMGELVAFMPGYYATCTAWFLWLHKIKTLAHMIEFKSILPWKIYEEAKHIVREQVNNHSASNLLPWHDMLDMDIVDVRTKYGIKVSYHSQKYMFEYEKDTFLRPIPDEDNIVRLFE